MQDEQISSNDFQNILQEIEKYVKLKTVIRNQRKESKSQYPESQCHLKYEATPPYSLWFYGL